MKTLDMCAQTICKPASEFDGSIARQAAARADKNSPDRYSHPPIIQRNGPTAWQPQGRHDVWLFHYAYSSWLETDNQTPPTRYAMFPRIDLSMKQLLRAA